MPTFKISLPQCNNSSPKASPPEPTVLNLRFGLFLFSLNDFIILRAVGGKKVFLTSNFSIKLKANSGSNLLSLWEITGIPKNKEGIKISNNPPIQAQSAGVQKQSVTGKFDDKNS